MELSEIFQERSAYADPIFDENIERLAANVKAQEERLAHGNQETKNNIAIQHQENDLRTRKEFDDQSVLFHMQVIQQAYEQFLKTYAETMAFYNDADHRIDNLEARIKYQLNDIESKTGLLQGNNGEAVYQNAQGGFYTVFDGEKSAITDKTATESLREQVKEVKSNGQTVRTEAQQENLVELTVMLTDTMNLREDAQENRNEASALKEQVEADKSFAPKADKILKHKVSELDGGVKALENKLNSMDASTAVDKTLQTDQSPDLLVVDGRLDGLRDSDPATSFGIP